MIWNILTSGDSFFKSWPRKQGDAEEYRFEIKIRVQSLQIRVQSSTKDTISLKKKREPPRTLGMARAFSIGRLRK
jgi:hypothetical protein